MCERVVPEGPAVEGEGWRKKLSSSSEATRDGKAIEWAMCGGRGRLGVASDSEEKEDGIGAVLKRGFCM